ncbi:unnamed protein product [Effrenium voratum]|nr:unnamed protein product [Effrenium voratum]
MLACRGFASSHVLFARTLCAWPAQKMPFRLTTRHSSSIQTVGVEALAEYIHAQINGTFSNVEEQLTELAQILGYMTEAQRQEICIADAKLLVEDIGACPLSLESHLRGGAETPSPEEDASSGAAMPALRGEETDAELAVQDVKGQLLRIASRADDNARNLQALSRSPADKVTVAAGRPATAAFLSSGLGCGGAAREMSQGAFHSSGGLQYLASREAATASATASTSASTSMSARQDSGVGVTLDSIQERLAQLRARCGDPEPRSDARPGASEGSVLSEAQKVLEKMERLGSLRSNLQ